MLWKNMNNKNYFITANIIQEAGYESAMRGVQLYRNIDFERAKKLAVTLASKDMGHNKFLESIIVWIEVIAPRYWWQEADTYRQSTKQSESSMYTLRKELSILRDSDNYNLTNYMETAFEDGSVTKEQISEMIQKCKESDLVGLKKLLPEGYLQRRIWCLSYKSLRGIILQRRKHKLPHWADFIAQVLLQVGNPELLPELER